MAEEKINFLPLPDVDVAESSEQIYLTGYTKSHRSKKCVVAVASVILILAAAIIVTLAGFFIGMHLGTTAPGGIVKFTYSPDPEVNEEVTSDSNTNTVQFHVKRPTYEMWAVDDFNTDIRVMKVLIGSRCTCYVTPLNRTTASEPSEFSAALHPVNVKSNQTYSMRYHAANTPIPDASFLSTISREMCRGVSTYWVYPSCHSEEGLTRRTKRWKLSMTIQWWAYLFSISFES